MSGTRDKDSKCCMCVYTYVTCLFERERGLISWFTPLKPMMVRARMVLTPGVRCLVQVYPQWQEPNCLGRHNGSPESAPAGSWSQETEPDPDGDDLMWGAGVLPAD